MNTSLALRKLLSDGDQGYVYSFWPDVLTLKEVGDPRDIGTYFQMWNEGHWLQARVISAQCRQNTNYKIVRYAAHPFFLEGYTLMGNGEDTFYQKNKEFLNGLHPGYIGFESDTQAFLYTLHYVVEAVGLAAELLQACHYTPDVRRDESPSGWSRSCSISASPASILK